MKRVRGRSLVIGLVSLVAVSCGASPNDANPLLGNVQNTGSFAATPIASAPSEKWAREVNTDSLVIAGDGFAIVGYDDTSKGIQLLDAKDGTVRWTVDGAIPEALPAVAGGKLFYSTNDGTLFSADAKTGKTIWEKKGLGGYSIVADEDRLFVSRERGIFSVDPKTGDMKWANKEIGQTREGIFAVSGDTIVVLDCQSYADPTFFALYANSGEIRWAFNEKRTGSDHTYNLLSANPVISGELAYVFYDRYLYGVNLATGVVDWRLNGEGMNAAGLSFDSASCPIVDNGVLYAKNGDGTLIAFDIATSAVKWAYALGEISTDVKAIVGDELYVQKKDAIAALDLATGKEKWLFPVKSYSERPFAVANGALYYMADYEVHALK